MGHIGRLLGKNRSTKNVIGMKNKKNIQKRNLGGEKLLMEKMLV